MNSLLLVLFTGMGVVTLFYALSPYPLGKRPFSIVAALVHIGGGLAALLAEDLIRLLIAWELLAFSGFFLVIGRLRDQRSLRCGYEYIAFQIVGAASLFAGMVIHYGQTGNLHLTEVHPQAQLFILFAVALKTAAMPLHFWLVDAYPSAPWPIAPMLSVYGTKVGVYTAARLLALPLTSWIGAFMALFGVLWALRQHSPRKLLSYHIISQVGYMLIGVGLATEPGITAGLFHAFNHIIYKALLFMVVGAVLYRTGEQKLSESGGLARLMPFTFVCGIIASASIAGAPFFSGFASKGLLKSAVGSGALYWVMIAASAGTGLSFIKLMWALFLKKPVGTTAPADAAAPPAVKEVPPAMLIPMGILALFSLLIGIFPSLFLPLPDYRYYSSYSLVSASIPIAFSFFLWIILGKRLLLPVSLPAVAGFLSPERAARALYGRTSVAVKQLLYTRTSFQIYILLLLALWLGMMVLFILFP